MAAVATHPATTLPERRGSEPRPRWPPPRAGVGPCPCGGSASWQVPQGWARGSEPPPPAQPEPDRQCIMSGALHSHDSAGLLATNPHKSRSRLPPALTRLMTLPGDFAGERLPEREPPPVAEARRSGASAAGPPPPATLCSLRLQGGAMEQVAGCACRFSPIAQPGHALCCVPHHSPLLSYMRPESPKPKPLP